MFDSVASTVLASPPGSVATVTFLGEFLWRCGSSCRASHRRSAATPPSPAELHLGAADASLTSGQTHDQHHDTTDLGLPRTRRSTDRRRGPADRFPDVDLTADRQPVPGRVRHLRNRFDPGELRRRRPRLPRERRLPEDHPGPRGVPDDRDHRGRHRQGGLLLPGPGAPRQAHRGGLPGHDDLRDGDDDRRSARAADDHSARRPGRRSGSRASTRPRRSRRSRSTRTRRPTRSASSRSPSAASSCVHCCSAPA